MASRRARGIDISSAAAPERGAKKRKTSTAAASASGDVDEVLAKQAKKQPKAVDCGTCGEKAKVVEWGVGLGGWGNRDTLCEHKCLWQLGQPISALPWDCRYWFAERPMPKSGMECHRVSAVVPFV